MPIERKSDLRQGDNLVISLVTVPHIFDVVNEAVATELVALNAANGRAHPKPEQAVGHRLHVERGYLHAVAAPSSEFLHGRLDVPRLDQPPLSGETFKGKA